MSVQRVPSPSGSSSDLFENTLIQCEGDDDLPVIYRADSTPAPPVSVDSMMSKLNVESTDFMLPHFEYAAGSKLFVYEDGDAFVPYTILSFDPKTTKASLQDGGGMISSLVLICYFGARS